jgi:hypothetical protein
LAENAEAISHKSVGKYFPKMNHCRKTQRPGKPLENFFVSHLNNEGKIR